MLIKIGRYEFTECWDGVLYKKLSTYPQISQWELQTIFDFMKYESDNGRKCRIEADDAIIQAIEAYRSVYDSGVRIHVPDRITECTACPGYKGCMTDLVCHTASAEDAISILESGRLLSAVGARKKTAGELMIEPRNAAHDPEDYFEYVMFAWGNCQAGDRLVMERKLGRFPDDTDLSDGFTPGIRFFFKYDRLVDHPMRVFDGVLPLKIRDEVILNDWVHAIVIPEAYREMLEPHIPNDIKDRTFCVENDCRDIWEWSEKVYECARHVGLLDERVIGVGRSVRHAIQYR